MNAVLPSGVSAGGTEMGVPVNYVVAAATLLAALTGSAALGIWWLGRSWVICAAIFYLVWTTVYTTMFTNLSGIFTGFWQGMGYWIAQQDVARGNQPWYYYFVGMSVYEILPPGVWPGGHCVFLPAPGCAGAGPCDMGRSFARGLHGGNRKDAMARGEHHHTVHTRRRQIPGRVAWASGVAIISGPSGADLDRHRNSDCVCGHPGDCPHICLPVSPV